MRAVGGAGSFSASPSANPAGRRKRFPRAGEVPVDECRAAAGHPGRGGRSRSGAGPSARPRRSAAARRRPPPAEPPTASSSSRPSRASSLRSSTASPTRPTRRPTRSSRPSGPPTRSSGCPTASAAATSSASPTTPTTARAPCPSRMHGAGLLATPRDSSSFMRYGARGQGPVDHRLHEPRPRLRGHRRGCAWTRAPRAIPRGGSGPRWRPNLRSTRGYRAPGHPRRRC